MNKQKLASSIVLLFSLFLMVSCTNEPVDPAVATQLAAANATANSGTTTTGGSLFKADFSGSTWNADSYQATMSSNQIQINGIKTNGEGFVFTVNSSSVGTYPANVNILSYNPAGSLYGYSSNNVNNPTEDTGSITISNIDTVNKTISGTFNFKGYWTNNSVNNILPIVFQNGVFQNVPYTNQSQTGNSFYAQVNGVDYIGTDINTSVINLFGQQFLSIGALDSNLHVMSIDVRTNLGPGTYTITGNYNNNVVEALYYNSTYAISGSVTIISKTATHIKGTFNYLSGALPPINVTQGTFDVDY